MSHELIDSNVKQFKCDVNDCKQWFKQRCGFYNHKMRFHSGIKRHKCFHNNCDKSFVTSDELKRHTRSKHPTNKPF